MLQVRKSRLLHPRDRLRHRRKAVQIQFIRTLEVVVDVRAIPLAVWVHADDRQYPIEAKADVLRQ